MVEGLRSRVASLTEHNRRLAHLLREPRRTLFAKKSEKLHPDQLQLAFEALEGVHGERLLEGCSGTAQADGYAGYHRLLVANIVRTTC